MGSALVARGRGHIPDFSASLQDLAPVAHSVQSICELISLCARRLLGEADHVLHPTLAADDTSRMNRLVKSVRIGGMCVPIMAGSWFAEAVEAV